MLIVVPADADSNPKVSAIPYELATGGAKVDPGAAARVQKVNNVTGSCAGAGSGEFHTYRKFRRLEEERVTNMTVAQRELKLEQEYQERIAQHREEEEARTAKNASKRRKRKERKQTKRQKKGDGSRADSDSEDSDAEEEEAPSSACADGAQLPEREEEPAVPSGFAADPAQAPSVATRREGSSNKGHEGTDGVGGGSASSLAPAPAAVAPSSSSAPVAPECMGVRSEAGSSGTVSTGGTVGAGRRPGIVIRDDDA